MAYYQKATKKLKSAGDITIRFPSLGRWGNGAAIEVHCDDGVYINKRGVKRRAGSVVF